MIEFLTVIVLGTVVIVQVIERRIYTKEMNEQISKYMKAILSRNINEYMAAVNMEKKPVITQDEPDEIELNSETDDKIFDDYIKKMNA